MALAAGAVHEQGSQVYLGFDEVLFGSFTEPFHRFGIALGDSVTG